MWSYFKRVFVCFRKHLETNEIIFKTLAATGLTVMSLIVSYSQWQVSTEQVRIAEAQAMPRFEIAIHQVMNSDTHHADDDIMVVTNAGGPVHDFQVQAVAFIQVNLVTAQYKTTVAAFPVSDYFRMTGVYATGTGELATVTGYRNNATFGDLNRQIHQVADGQHATAFLGMWTYAYITYTDILERDHHEYYFVPDIGLATRMPDEEGKRIYVHWDDYQSPDRVTLEGLKPESLFDRALKTIGTTEKPFHLP